MCGVVAVADPRVQQARERAEGDADYLPGRDIDFLLRAARVAKPLRDSVDRLDRHIAVTRDDVLYLADRVAALETALRFVRPEFAQADNVESWHWGHVKRGEPYAEDCGLCIIDAALVGSGTEPAPAEGSA